MNTTAESASPRPARARTVAAALAAVLLAGSAVSYAVTRAGATGGAIRLRWHEGQTLRYRSTLGLRGEATPAGSAGSSFTFRVVETLTWRVRSVDDRGTAIIDLTASDVRVEGGPAPGPRPGRVTGTMTVDRRGRVLAAADAWLLTGGPGVATYLPGLEQVVPYLPPGPVTAGATWAAEVSPRVAAFGSAPHEHLAGLSEVSQQVGATIRPVIRTSATATFDGTLDVGSALAAAGRGTGFGAGIEPTIGYAGATHTEQMAWIDGHASLVDRTRTTGRFDLTITSEGYPVLFPTFQTGEPGGESSAPFGGLAGAVRTAAPTTVRMRGSLFLELDRLG